jgi:hypothetical protein
LSLLSFGDFDGCIDTDVSGLGVVDVQHQFVDPGGLRLLLKRIGENPVVLGAFPNDLRQANRRCYC